MAQISAIDVSFGNSGPCNVRNISNRSYPLDAISSFSDSTHATSSGPRYSATNAATDSAFFWLPAAFFFSSSPPSTSMSSPPARSPGCSWTRF